MPQIFSQQRKKSGRRGSNRSSSTPSPPMLLSDSRRPITKPSGAFMDTPAPPVMHENAPHSSGGGSNPRSPTKSESASGGPFVAYGNDAIPAVTLGSSPPSRMKSTDVLGGPFVSFGNEGTLATAFGTPPSVIHDNACCDSSSDLHAPPTESEGVSGALSVAARDYAPHTIPTGKSTVSLTFENVVAAVPSFYTHENNRLGSSDHSSPKPQQQPSSGKMLPSSVLHNDDGPVTHQNRGGAGLATISRIYTPGSCLSDKIAHGSTPISDSDSGHIVPLERRIITPPPPPPSSPVASDRLAEETVIMSTAIPFDSTTEPISKKKQQPVVRPPDMGLERQAGAASERRTVAATSPAAATASRSTSRSPKATTNRQPSAGAAPVEPEQHVDGDAVESIIRKLKGTRPDLLRTTTYYGVAKASFFMCRGCVQGGHVKTLFSLLWPLCWLGAPSILGYSALQR